MVNPEHGSADVSVIVPVGIGERKLPRCLEALRLQTLPNHRWEVVIVFNGGNAAPDFRSPLPNSRLLWEPIVGSYAARNTAIKTCRSQILAFTDADCQPDPLWLENGMKRLIRETDKGERVIVGGKIDIFFPENRKSQPVYQCYDKLISFDQERFVNVLHFGATANVFCYRTLFETVGLFDDDLASGGDFLWGLKAYLAGCRVVYSEEAIVRHPTSRTFFEYLRRVFRREFGLSQIGKRMNLNRVELLTDPQAYKRYLEEAAQSDLIQTPFRRWRFYQLIRLLRTIGLVEQLRGRRSK